MANRTGHPDGHASSPYIASNLGLCADHFPECSQTKRKLGIAEFVTKYKELELELELELEIR